MREHKLASPKKTKLRKQQILYKYHERSKSFFDTLFCQLQQSFGVQRVHSILYSCKKTNRFFHPNPRWEIFPSISILPYRFLAPYSICPTVQTCSCCLQCSSSKAHTVLVEWLEEHSNRNCSYRSFQSILQFLTTIHGLK